MSLQRNLPDSNPCGLTITVPAEVLDPLIRKIVSEVTRQLPAGLVRGDDKLLMTEVEAAHRLSLARHQLRDLRLGGKISFRRGPGRRIFYSPNDLSEFVANQRGNR